MIDSHAHLNSEEFKDEVDALILDAHNNNVKEIIVVGMYEKANKETIKLIDLYPNLYGSVGLHPSYVKEGIDFQQLESQLTHQKIVALGEIGIDLYWEKDNLETQIMYFRKQIELAIKYDLPVIIHMRSSVVEIYDVLKDYHGKLKGVLHCFTEDYEWANKFIDLGFYIGIGGIVTFKNAPLVKEVATKIPLEKLLVETDSPYLAPTPYRHKRNVPAYTRLVLEEIAKLRNIDVSLLDEITTKNTKKLFYKMEE